MEWESVDKDSSPLLSRSSDSEALVIGLICERNFSLTVALERLCGCGMFAWYAMKRILYKCEMSKAC